VEDYTDPKINFVTCSFCGLKALPPDRLVNLCREITYHSIDQWGDSNDYNYLASWKFDWIDETTHLPYFASIPLLSSIQLWFCLLDRAVKEKTMPDIVKFIITDYANIDRGRNSLPWHIPQLIQDRSPTLVPTCEPINLRKLRNSGEQGKEEEDEEEDDEEEAK
jgi:hypothetical protein